MMYKVDIGGSFRNSRLGFSCPWAIRWRSSLRPPS